MNPTPIPPVATHQNPSIQFVITRWDLFQCRLWAITQNRFLVGLILFCTVIVPLIGMPEPKDFPHPILFKVIVFLIGSGIMFFFMCAVQILTQVAYLFSDKNRGVLGQQNLEIRDDALVVRCETGESTHLWMGFRKMRSIGGFLFLYVGGNIVYYIPLRTFPSPGAAENFKNEIIRHSRAAK
jgi:hypothetical protein